MDGVRAGLDCGDDRRIGFPDCDRSSVTHPHRTALIERIFKSAGPDQLVATRTMVLLLVNGVERT